MQPKIEKMDIKVIGIQKVINHQPGYDFRKDVDETWKKVLDKLGDIKNVHEDKRAIGFWHWINKLTKVYFAGIQVDSLKGFVWDREYGLCSWDLGEITVAIFKEKNGEEGTIASSPEANRQVSEMGYRFDGRFIGDFEVFPLEWIKNTIPDNEYHEVWIPVIKK
ncbi:MAG: hypothetical protein FK734_10050 [Asgard group archaeon]|nr:hypothetical protein [Asgard group archaeon]